MNPYDDDTVDELPVAPRKDIPAEDRELLELAARALGAVRVEEVDGEGYLNLHMADGSVVYAWNSLVHSDDAFNLGVDLKLGLHTYPSAAAMSRCSFPKAALFMSSTRMTAKTQLAAP